MGVLFVTNIYQFKAKDSKIKIYLLRLGNISGDFSASNIKIKEKTGLNGCVHDFSVTGLLILVILSISISISWKNMI